MSLFEKYNNTISMYDKYLRYDDAIMEVKKIKKSISEVFDNCLYRLDKE